MAVQLPPSVNCPNCGAAVASADWATHQSAEALGLTSADVVAFRALLAKWPQYFTPAVRKHHFGLTVTNRTPASQIPWNANRIASIFIPSQPVWFGGDTTVTAASGGNAGLPIVANAQVIFGPEEGNSASYLIAAAPSVDVRCLELLST